MSGMGSKMMQAASKLNTGRENPFAAQETTAEYQNGASNGLTKLAPALIKAQAKLKNAKLNKVNPHFKSRYADLAEIRDTVNPVLTDNGLAVIQFTTFDLDGFALVTRLLHESGEYIDSTYPLPGNVDKPQQMGSAITYARRYMLAAMCGITAEEDDDGNAAQENPNGRGQSPSKGAAKNNGANPKANSQEAGASGSDDDGVIL